MNFDIEMSGDSWALQYDSCAQLGRDVMARINQRSREPRGSSAHARLSAQIRGDMREFSTNLTELREELIRHATSRAITTRESERRQAMLDELISREKQINAAASSDSVSAQHRSMLMGSPASSEPWGGDAGWGEEQDDPLLSVHGIRQQQQHAIQQQDEGLDALSSVLHRQKQMAIDIGNEVDQQDDLLDDIHDHMDRTDQRLIRETKHVKMIDRKSAACWYWVVIIVLLVAIVVICVIPT